MVTLCKQNIFQDETFECANNNDDNNNNNNESIRDADDPPKQQQQQHRPTPKLVLVRLLGEGARCYGVEAKLYDARPSSSSNSSVHRILRKKKPYTRVLAKITYDHRLYHWENEYQIYFSAYYIRQPVV